MLTILVIPSMHNAVGMIHLRPGPQQHKNLKRRETLRRQIECVPRPKTRSVSFQEVKHRILHLQSSGLPQFDRRPLALPAFGRLTISGHDSGHYPGSSCPST